MRASFRFKRRAVFGDLRFIHGTPRGYKGTVGQSLYRVESDADFCQKCARDGRRMYRFAVIRGETRVLWLPGSFCSTRCMEATLGPLPKPESEIERIGERFLVAAIVAALLLAAFTVGVRYGRAQESAVVEGRL